MCLISTNKINITLCGMMGSGKSLIGQMLAKNLNFKFIDTDKLIEKKTGESINEIFNKYGEKYFRELEEREIISILNNKKFVISLGGGSIESKNIRNILRVNSFNIYLEVKHEILKKRLRFSNHRPPLNSQDVNSTLIKLLKKRKKYYHQADIIIQNDKSSNSVLKQIINKLNNNDKKN